MNNQLAMASHQHYKEMTLNEKMLFEGLLCTLILPSLCHQLFLSTPNILFMNELGTPQRAGIGLAKKMCLFYVQWL